MSCDDPSDPIVLAPGASEPECYIGIRRLLDTTDVLAGYPDALDPMPTIVCDDSAEIVASEIGFNAEAKTILGKRYAPGQALKFKLDVGADVEDGDYEITISGVETEAGFKPGETTKTVRVEVNEA